MGKKQQNFADQLTRRLMELTTKDNEQVKINKNKPPNTTSPKRYSITPISGIRNTNTERRLSTQYSDSYLSKTYKSPIKEKVKRNPVVLIGDKSKESKKRNRQTFTGNLNHNEVQSQSEKNNSRKRVKTFYNLRKKTTKKNNPYHDLRSSNPPYPFHSGSLPVPSRNPKILGTYEKESKKERNNELYKGFKRNKIFPKLKNRNSSVRSTNSMIQEIIKTNTNIHNNRNNTTIGLPINNSNSQEK